jgi:hypothetical protein
LAAALVLGADVMVAGATQGGGLCAYSLPVDPVPGASYPAVLQPAACLPY